VPVLFFTFVSLRCSFYQVDLPYINEVLSLNFSLNCGLSSVISLYNCLVGILALLIISLV